MGACLTARDYGRGVPRLLRREGIGRGIFLTTHGDASSCYDAARDIVMPSVSPTLQDIDWDDVTNDASVAPFWTAYFRGTIEWRWHGRKDATYSKVRGEEQPSTLHAPLKLNSFAFVSR